MILGVGMYAADKPAMIFVVNGTVLGAIDEVGIMDVVTRRDDKDPLLIERQDIQ